MADMEATLRAAGQGHLFEGITDAQHSALLAQVQRGLTVSSAPQLPERHPSPSDKATPPALYAVSLDGLMGGGVHPDPRLSRSCTPSSHPGFLFLARHTPVPREAEQG